MALRNTTARWGALAQALHWSIVALLVVQVTLAALADDLPPGARKLGLLAWHKSFGITVLLLAGLRLAWRLANPSPVLPRSLKPWERRLAPLTHGALYVLIFAQPISGWLMSSARGFPVSWFGLFQLPDLVPKSKPLFDGMVALHGMLATALYVVVALHVLAALKHHFIYRDDVLRRMLPFTHTPPGDGQSGGAP